MVPYRMKRCYYQYPFAWNDPKSRPIRMKIKLRFHYSRMRIWPNVGRNAYSMLPLIALQMIQNQDHFS